MSVENYSIVEFLGSDGGHKCGYCKSEEGNHNQVIMLMMDNIDWI